MHALFELAANVLQRTDNLDEHESIREAIADTQLNTIVGPVSWREGAATIPDGAPNVSKTPLVGGQWRRGGQFPFDLVVITKNQNGIRAVSDIRPIR